MNTWPPSAVGANFFLFQACQLIVIEEKKGNIIKNVLDQMAKLEFKFSRVKVMAEGIPMMVVESMTRDVKVLYEELRTAVVRNNKLKESLAKLRTEIEEVKARMKNMHATEERGGDNAH